MASRSRWLLWSSRLKSPLQSLVLVQDWKVMEIAVEVAAASAGLLYERCCMCGVHACWDRPGALHLWAGEVGPHVAVVKGVPPVDQLLPGIALNQPCLWRLPAGRFSTATQPIITCSSYKRSRPFYVVPAARTTTLACSRAVLGLSNDRLFGWVVVDAILRLGKVEQTDLAGN